MAGLEQVQGLHLQQTLSPQMQQSLQILQAPLLDLRQAVAKELMENPVLEEETPYGSSLETQGKQQGDLADSWDTYYAQQRFSNPSEANEKHQLLMDSLTKAPSLQETVRSQIAFLAFTRKEREIAYSIAGNLGLTGYLEAKLEEIAFQNKVTPLEVEEVLDHLQRVLEPPGLGAKNLQDCLLIQLRRERRGDTLEAAIVKRFLPHLARRRIAEIAKALGVSQDAVQSAAVRISKLEPNPARGFDSEPDMEVVAEVIVEREEDGFSIRLNRDEIPSLRISNDYKDILGQTAHIPKETKEYLREKIRGGRFFIKSLEQRNETILAIAKEIVERQREFMESGPSFLKPMTMGTVAEAVGVHETTVSRAVSGKYMSTPHGFFEMKYFFTSGYTTQSGEEISNESVRKALQELVAEEDERKPYSDEQIVKLLGESGIKVARRTIAKYRDQLHILPSHLRKR